MDQKSTPASNVNASHRASKERKKVCVHVEIPRNPVMQVSTKGRLISKWFFWCLQFSPKNEQKQVNLRFHSSKVEFVPSFFGGKVCLKT